MERKRFIFYTQEGNVSRLPADFSRHSRSRALAVSEEPKVPTVIHSGLLVALGLAAFAAWAILRKD